MSNKPYSDYDSFAWFYNKYWGDEFARPALAIFDLLLFPLLAKGSRVLDLCCGTGQLAAGMLERGFQVTGLDGSEPMLEFARANAPAAEFICADARSFTLPQTFQAVVSTFDSLNHIMTLNDLAQVFRHVHAVLANNSVFLFDLNMEDENEKRVSTIDMLGEDHACIVRASYDEEEKLKRYEVTMFRRAGRHWKRTDLTLLQRYYEEAEVCAALAHVGFSRITTYDARREFGMTLSDGRMFFLARK